jgi:hypothetical protein
MEYAGLGASKKRANREKREIRGTVGGDKNGTKQRKQNEMWEWLSDLRSCMRREV